MARKNYTVEQIIVKLREIELHCNQGKPISEACRGLGITEQTYYRWRKEYGGMNASDARRMKELEKENARLKKLVAEQALDISILRDENSKNFYALPCDKRLSSMPWSTNMWQKYGLAGYYKSTATVAVMNL